MNRIKRGALLSLIITCLILGQLPVDGQTRRPGARQRPAAPARPAENAQPPRQPQGAAAPAATSEQAQLIESPKRRALSEAFETGKLPEPARLPPGSADERALALAKAVAAGDASSTAALYAAVLAAGYGVRDAEGNVLRTTERGQGLTFDASEVAGMAKLYGEGYGVGLGHLGEAFTRHVPELKGAPLAAGLLEGIRAGAASDHPALRFWARFIVGLGRHSAEPYDLLGQVDPARVRLDAVQVFLVLSRLAGEAAISGRAVRQARQTFPTAEAGGGHAARFRRAGFRAVSGAAESGRVKFIRARMSGPGGWMPAPAQSPCSGGDIQSLVEDVGALGSTTLFDHVLKPHNISLGHANLVLTVLKFILSYALLRKEIIAVAINPVLERTKDTRPGRELMLAAKVWIDDKLEQLNCQRMSLNMHGLDFNLPKPGPLANVNVVWSGIVGFDEGNRDWRDDAQDFLESMNLRATPGNNILSFDFMGGTERSRTEQYTNEKGYAFIKVVGKPQGKDLSREKLLEVNKLGGVRVWVQLKSTKIKNVTDALSTAGDAAGPVIAFLTGDPVGGTVGAAIEALYRLSWRPSEPYYFVVKDWEPCEAWQGTISVKHEHSETKDNTGGRGSGISETTEVKNEYEATYNLTSTKDTSEGFKNGYFADVVSRIDRSQVNVYKNPYEGGFCDTGRRDARGSKITEAVRGVSTHTNRLENVAAGTGRATVYIAPRGAEGYNILTKPPPPITGVNRRIVQFQFPQCPMWEKVRSRDGEERPQTYNLPPIEFVATFDANGALKGSKTVPVQDGKGGTITYKWDLQKCK